MLSYFIEVNPTSSPGGINNRQNIDVRFVQLPHSNMILKKTGKAQRTVPPPHWDRAADGDAASANMNEENLANK